MKSIFDRVATLTRVSSPFKTIDDINGGGRNDVHQIAFLVGT